MCAMSSVTPPPTAAPSRSRRRPFTLVVLALLLVVKAVMLGLLATGVALSTQDWLRAMIGKDLVQVLVAIPGASGWILALAALLVLSAAGLSGFYSGTTNHIWMLLNIVTVFYLNQRDVREVVGAMVPEPQRPAVHA